MAKAKETENIPGWEKGIVHPENREGDEKDISLRPKTLDEFLGQKTMKENLSVFIKAAKELN